MECGHHQIGHQSISLSHERQVLAKEEVGIVAGEGGVAGEGVGGVTGVKNQHQSNQGQPWSRLRPPSGQLRSKLRLPFLPLR
jgi:hypothetical protein